MKRSDLDDLRYLFLNDPETFEDLEIYKTCSHIDYLEIYVKGKHRKFKHRIYTEEI